MTCSFWTVNSDPQEDTAHANKLIITTCLSHFRKKCKGRSEEMVNLGRRAGSLPFRLAVQLRFKHTVPMVSLNL